MKKSIAAAALLTTASVMGVEKCAPESPAKCYPDDCQTCYCLGPAPIIANAPVCPMTCNGDFFVSVAGFYWNSHQDGLEYAVSNSVQQPVAVAQGFQQFPTLQDYQSSLEQNNNLVKSEYEIPHFRWDFGFKVGVGYCMTCDGWDIGVTWTWYRGKASDHVEAEFDNNHTLLPLWAQFTSVTGIFPFATDIDTDWRLKLNLIDIELGRNFWASKYLSIRPHIGLRIAYLDQEFQIEQSGGGFSPPPSNIVGGPFQPELIGHVDLENDFHGVGIRSGLDSYWHLGCGFAFYGNAAASIVYGRFHVEHDEWVREASGNHTKTDVLETEESFRSSRAMLDLGLGIQWESMFCECKYGFLVSLGWEEHLFFHQNQLWRVSRVGAVPGGDTLPINLGQNIHQHRRGTLDTQGWTLKARFAF